MNAATLSRLLIPSSKDPLFHRMREVYIKALEAYSNAPTSANP